VIGYEEIYSVWAATPPYLGSTKATLYWFMFPLIQPVAVRLHQSTQWNTACCSHL